MKTQRSPYSWLAAVTFAGALAVVGGGCSEGSGNSGDGGQTSSGGSTGGSNTGGSLGGSATGGSLGGTATGGSTGGSATGGSTGGSNTGGSATGGSTGGGNTGGSAGGSDFVADHSNTNLDAIPDSAIQQAKATLHIAYQHTSHGSQIITGMDALEAYPPFNGFYSWQNGGGAGALDLHDGAMPACADLSQGDWVDGNGDTPWVVATREYLNDPANSNVNVVLWSWCSINGHDAQRYVDNMEKLIAEYPAVTFVFMTGHAEGGGEDVTPNSVYYNDQLIREHAAANGRWLFDFADIEAYDPNGNYYWDQALYDNLNYSGGNWAVQYCAANQGSELQLLTQGDGASYGGCQGCAHSDSPQEANLNCVLKARAAWWLFSRIAGWNGQ